MIKKISTLLILSLLSNYSFSQLEVLDPENWGFDQGSIAELEVDVRLDGMFAEVAYTFDVFASHPDYFYPNSQLEYVMYFDLPKKAVVNDSWLWIEDYISKGEIYDRNVGTQIYESIVDRRQDPSILTKWNSTHYELRIYPMKRDSTRKVMFSYLIPLEHGADKSTLDLNFDVFNYSIDDIENVRLSVEDGVHWQHQNLTSDNISMVNEGNIESNYTINQLKDQQSLQIDFMRNQQSQFFMGTYESPEENYYQLLYFPDIDIEPTPRKVMFALDFDSHHSNMGLDDFLTSFENSLLALAGTNNEFNIVYSDFTTEIMFSDFVPATPNNISVAIEKLRDESIDVVSNLQQVLGSGLSFLSTYEERVEFVLISSNGDFGSQSNIDFIMENIRELADPNYVTIHINDLTTKNYEYTVDNQSGITYIGNEQLYELIANEYNGQSSYAYEENTFSNLSALLGSAQVISTLFEFDVEVEDGFDYERYFLNNSDQALVFGEPIMVVGKYYGDSPSSIELSAVVNGELFNMQSEVTQMAALSNLTEKIWAGQRLLDIEFIPDLREETIELSMKHRLLSFPTVFLCLEEDFDIGGLTEEEDISIVDTDDLDEPKISLSASPNPFTDVLRIELDAENLDWEDIVIDVFDMQGQLITSLTPDASNGSVIELNWNASDVPSGMYILKLRSSIGNKVIKVMKA